MKVHRQSNSGFSYVGACQRLMGIYMFASSLVRRIVRRAQVPPAPERGSRSDGPVMI